MRSTHLRQLTGRVVDQAIALGAEGSPPFAALVATESGTVLGAGVNEVAMGPDPTAHAEIMAIRAACRHVRRTRLEDAVLVTSAEPCGLCYLAALMAGITGIVYVADRHMAARGGFDYRDTYRFFGVDAREWPMEVQAHPRADASRMFGR